MVAALADDSANGFKGGAADPAPCPGLQATQDLPVTARIRADSRNGGTFVLAELPSQSDEVFGIHADTSTHFTDGKKPLGIFADMEITELQTVIRRRLVETGNSQRRAALEGNLSPDTVRNVLAGHMPRLDRALQIFNALHRVLHRAPRRLLPICIPSSRHRRASVPKRRGDRGRHGAPTWCAWRCRWVATRFRRTAAPLTATLSCTATRATPFTWPSGATGCAATGCERTA